MSNEETEEVIDIQDEVRLHPQTTGFVTLEEHNNVIQKYDQALDTFNDLMTVVEVAGYIVTDQGLKRISSPLIPQQDDEIRVVLPDEELNPEQRSEIHDHQTEEFSTSNRNYLIFALLPCCPFLYSLIQIIFCVTSVPFIILLANIFQFVDSIQNSVIVITWIFIFLINISFFFLWLGTLICGFIILSCIVILLFSITNETNEEQESTIPLIINPTENDDQVTEENGFRLGDQNRGEVGRTMVSFFPIKQEEEEERKIVKPYLDYEVVEDEVSDECEMEEGKEEDECVF